MPSDYYQKEVIKFKIFIKVTISRIRKWSGVEQMFIEQMFIQKLSKCMYTMVPKSYTYTWRFFKKQYKHQII